MESKMLTDQVKDGIKDVIKETLSDRSFMISVVVSSLIVGVGVWFAVAHLHDKKDTIYYMLWSCALMLIPMANFIRFMLKPHILNLLVGYAGTAACGIMIVRYIMRYLDGPGI